jgi:PAS domain S-box-containing protein
MADNSKGRDADPLAFLAGGGEMGERTRAFDWSKTPVGSLAGWPQSLKTLVRTMLDSRYAMWLGWGPDFTFFYNDAYAKMTLGPKHPRALGKSVREVWSEIWTDIGPRAESVIRTGEATWDEGLLLFLERQGFREETYHTFSYSPVPDDTGGVGGMLCVVTEDTERTIGERRLRTLRELAARTNDVAKSVEEACQTATRTLIGNPYDLPFVVLYLLSDDGRRVRLVGQSGLGPDSPACPADVDLAQSLWPFRQVAESGNGIVVDDLRERFGALPGGAWPEPASRALVLPMAKPGQARPTGFVVSGISPRLVFNDGYRGFLDLLAGHIATAIANARAYEEEWQRAEKLAELDRAKTAFFSNVSHEFRTPLTLMLGPVEDALAGSDGPLPPLQRDRLELAHRNALRLQRLVNSLLDFARIEAGRVGAAYEPTDLAEFTGDLASNFRSACEKAGLRLTVDCPPLGEAVFVDRPMWEKIVLNLLSNAFKFTFEGEIAVSMRRAEHAALLRVRDTGTGIPAEEMPRLFERFHRIENARGRTHEGSGIGLALVHELVKLHGGSITAESELGRGTTFVISIPLGKEHLPCEQVGSSGTAAPPTAGANPFVGEALRWLPGAGGPDDLGPDLSSLPNDLSAPVPPRRPDAGGPRVLVADDNADMRRYVLRLLSGQYAVEAVPDGAAALDSVRRQLPDMIVSDVMMPRLDGFGLLRALRADPRTASVPVVLLSARAGEESRVEGMEAGADDYLVKPFSAREFLARVGALLQITRLRRESEQAIRQSEERERQLLLEVATANAQFRAFFEQGALFAGIMQLDGTVIEANRLSLEACGYTREEVIGKPFWDCPWWHRSPDLVRRIKDATAQAAAGETFRAEMPYFVAGGERMVDFILLPVKDEAGRVTFLAPTGTDITDRKRAEEALQQSDRRKDEFLAILAHELRNPLAPIRNGLQIMRLGKGDPEAIEQARTMMERQLGQMVHLVDDLLDLSRISRGKIELRKERVELSMIVQRAVETSRPLIEANCHDLTITVPPGPIYVDADVTRVAQVFSNLLNNAAKYTERGGRVQLNVQRRGGEVVVSVKDNGVGIPAHMLPLVFEMFTQVDRNIERSQGGLGIGLSIVKRLVEMHGGSVRVESDGPGTGSEFVVRLPVVLSVAQPNGVDEADARPLSRRRILVVDDNVDAAMSLAIMLKLMGNETKTAHDGLEALDVAGAFRPDVILLDIGMPRLNGHETAKRIREQPWGKSVMLVALTGWGQEEDRRKSDEAGFDSHMVKPVEPAAVERLLANLHADTA